MPTRWARCSSRRPATPTLDAGGFNPANVSKALKVAAVDRFDAKASFSNFGSEIDVRRPASTCCRWSAGRADTYC